MAYTRSTSTIPDDNPGGDSIRQAIVDRLSAGIDDVYTSLNDLDDRVNDIESSIAELKTTDFNAAAYGKYLVDDGVTATLPGTPTVGQWVQITPAGSLSEILADPPVVARNGNNIFGVAEDLNVNGVGTVILTWAGSSYGGWV